MRLKSNKEFRKQIALVHKKFKKHEILDKLKEIEKALKDHDSNR